MLNCGGPLFACQEIFALKSPILAGEGIGKTQITSLHGQADGDNCLGMSSGWQRL
jgi:hypothetical protein